MSSAKLEKNVSLKRDLICVFVIQTSIEKKVPIIEPSKYIFCRRIIQTESKTSISIPILLLAQPIIPCFAAVINSKNVEQFLDLVLLMKLSCVSYNRKNANR